MSEEIIENTLSEENTEISEISEKPSLMPGFKSVCTRLGIVMIIVFVSRILIVALSVLIAPWLVTLDSVPYELVNLALSAVFLYAVPMISAVFLLKHPIKSSGRNVYSKPRYFGRALAMFPAGYGVAITVRILTMIAASFLAGTPLGDSFTATEEAFAAPDIPTAVIMFLQMTVMAPILEELWFRGLVMESLRPYGNGFAIFISAILFGMTHANFDQFFYATALGIVLGYIAVSTGSIVTTTVMHAMYNSISAMMILLAADESVGDYLLETTAGREGVITPMVVVYIVWLVLVMLLVAVGVIMAIYKLIRIKRYRVPKVQTELPAKKRWGIFFSRASVIVMLLLAAVCFMQEAVVNLFYNMFAGSPS